MKKLLFGMLMIISVSSCTKEAINCSIVISKQRSSAVPSLPNIPATYNSWYVTTENGTFSVDQYTWNQKNIGDMFCNQ